MYFSPTFNTDLLARYKMGIVLSPDEKAKLDNVINYKLFED